MQQDFLVSEDGHQRRIATFEEVTPSADRLTPRPQKPGIFSNSLADSTRERHLTIILLDEMNTGPLEMAVAREQLIKFFSRQEKLDPVTILVTRPDRLRVIQPFTSDPAKLIKAAKLLRQRGASASMFDAPLDVRSLALAIIPTLGPRGTDAGASANTGPWTHATDTGEQNFADLQGRVQATTTAEWLAVIARAFQGVPGRKSLIWISAGVPLTFANYTWFQRAWDALNNANISVYSMPADIGVANPEFIGADANLNTRGDSSSMRMSLREVNRNAYNLRMDSLIHTRRETGGASCGNLLLFENCFTRAVRDSSHYYLLGYYLDKDTKPGWHKIRVRCLRKQAKVYARRGFDVPREVEPEAQRRRELIAAVTAPLNFTGLTVIVRWTKMDPKTGLAAFEIALPGKQGLYDRDERAFSLDLAWNANPVGGGQAKSRSGAIVARPFGSRLVEGRLPPDKAARVDDNGLIWSDNVVLNPGQYQVNFVVRDNVTGRVGSVWAPLDFKE